MSPNPTRFPSASLLERYIQRQRDELALYQKAAAQEDFGLIELHAHRLKGNGTSFGFPEVSEIGNHLEEAAKAADTAAILRGIAQFECWLTSLGGV